MKLLLGALCLLVTGCGYDETDAAEGSLAAGADTASIDQNTFAFLSVTGNRIESLHGVAYQIEAAPVYSVIGPKNRMDEFDGVPYQISLAAFVRETAAVMIHAETVADQSGASNYDNLTQSGWPNSNFRSNGPTCLEISAEDISGEHDLEWLGANGFDPVGILMFGQYFSASSDFNDEVVISVIVRVESCDDTQSNIQSYQSRLSEIAVTQAN